MQDELDNFGVDWDGPVPYDGDGAINVPETECPLTLIEMDEMLTVIPPFVPRDT